jgi:hypothetical protein
MIRELLDELSRDVPNYADPDRALAAGRRIRRRHRALTGAALAAAVGVVAATALWWPGPAPPERPAPPADNGYPPRIATPATPRPLPAGAVGPALLVYQPRCVRCDDIIVLADGTQYSLRGAGHQSASLSPDGRWLVAPFHTDRFQIRDLTGERGVVDLPGAPLNPRDEWEPMTWSPDGRWLLMWRARPTRGAGYEHVRIDPAAGTAVRYESRISGEPIAVLPDGDLLEASAEWTVPLTLRRVDPATGAERARYGVEVTLRPGENLRQSARSPAPISPDGTRAVLEVRAGSRTVAVLEIDLTVGAVLRRHELPDDAKWIPAAYPGPHILLVNFEPLRIGALEPDTGRVTVLTELPNPLALLVRGGHTWF